MNTAYCYECKECFDINSDREQRLFDSTGMCPACREKVIGASPETEYLRMLAILEKFTTDIEACAENLRSQIKTILKEIK